MSIWCRSPHASEDTRSFGELPWISPTGVWQNTFSMLYIHEPLLDYKGYIHIHNNQHLFYMSWIICFLHHYTKTSSHLKFLLELLNQFVLNGVWEVAFLGLFWKCLWQNHTVTKDVISKNRPRLWVTTFTMTSQRMTSLGQNITIIRYRICRFLSCCSFSLDASTAAALSSWRLIGVMVSNLTQFCLLVNKTAWCLESTCIFPTASLGPRCRKSSICHDKFGPPFLFPLVHILRNIWTPWSLYFRDIWTPVEKCGPPYKLSRVFV